MLILHVDVAEVAAGDFDRGEYLRIFGGLVLILVLILVPVLGLGLGLGLGEQGCGRQQDRATIPELVHDLFLCRLGRDRKEGWPAELHRHGFERKARDLTLWVRINQTHDDHGRIAVRTIMFAAVVAKAPGDAPRRIPI
ncbi:MAG: hypothetical protein ABI190_00200, partial [Casimicrobiaceae bacterium]